MAFMVFLISTFSIKVPETHAIGVIGANAVKSVVIGSMEKAGVTFASKEAKEKAFQAWNMKAYDKWKADEAAGRNADLWATWHAFEQNPSSALQPAPDAPDKPGVGKFLLNSTIFGMAIGIGAEIGYAIEDAQVQNRAMQYLVSNYEGLDASTSVNDIFGFYNKVSHLSNPSYYGGYHVYNYLYSPDGKSIAIAKSSLKGEVLPAYINKVDKVTISGVPHYRFTYIKYDRPPSTGQVSEYTSTSSHTIPVSDIALNTTGDGFKVESVPKPEHVPMIAPVPELAPLIAPAPDLAVIPEILPPDVPVEVVIPSAPESDPFWDGEINDPYVPPTPGDNPDPDKPPGDDDPDKPPGDDVDPDKPPGTLPPPDMDKPPVETPEYPEGVTDPEGASTGGLFSKLFEWLKALLDALFKILNAILAIPALIINALKALILALFVPADGFWDENVNDLRKIVTDELDTEDLIDNVDDLGGVSGGQFKDVIVSLMGVDNLEVIDADSVNKVLDIIHKWVRGVVFPFLIFYNINQLYKLIRGTSLVEATRNLNRVKGE